jgi:hypothetical protein
VFPHDHHFQYGRISACGARKLDSAFDLGLCRVLIFVDQAGDGLLSADG